MENGMVKMEIMEAVSAGERALGSLERAAEQLRSARKWGIFDMMGGGFLSTMVKHSRMDGATVWMEEASHHLKIFQKELRDISVPAELRLEIGTFLTFADFFFDDIISDYMVQRRIAEARDQVDEAIRQIQGILSDLHKLLNGQMEG